MRFLLIIAQLLCLLVAGNGQDPGVDVSGSVGYDITSQVVNRINGPGIFSDDFRFLLNLAAVETRYGSDNATYVGGSNGGIWLVNETAFASTQDNTTYPELTQIFVDIQAEFGIVWTDVTWEQLSVPLYSGLACRILLVIIGQPIPVTVELQAVYWITYINVQGDVNVFINVVIIIINGGPLIPGSRSFPVVDRVIILIRDSNIFPDDKKLLIRIACVESRYGVDPNTYRGGFYGGIWQIRQDVFVRTQVTISVSAELQIIYNQIQVTFGIVWTELTWFDLRTPLYSALAACIVIFQAGVQCPATPALQAIFWVTYFNPGGNVQFFIVRLVCKGDPHVTHLVSGSDKPLCYDVFGGEGVMYEMLAEPELDLRVTARLISDPYTNNRDAYIGQVMVFAGGHTINITTDGAAVGQHLTPWNVPSDRYISKDRTVQLSVTKRAIVVGHHGLIWIGIKKRGKKLKFLELEVERIGRMDRIGDKGIGIGGVLGTVSSDTEIITRDDRTYLVIRDRDDDSTSLAGLHDAKHCWKLAHHKDKMANAFKKLLLKNTLSCMTC